VTTTAEHAGIDIPAETDLDRAPGLLRPLVRHGRAVSIVGGGLVVAIGVAMLLNLLSLLPQYFQFNTAI